MMSAAAHAVRSHRAVLSSSVFDMFLMPSGSDVGSTGNQQLKSGCGDLLRENPEMKQVHSVASAAALLKRVADSDAA